MFTKIKNLIKSKQVKQENVQQEQQTVTDFTDPTTGQVTKSALSYDRNNERFLKLDAESCALVMHPDNKVEIIFTKLYDAEQQKITLEEETLMSIAVFLQQPGFAEMLRTEFHNIAMNNISKLTGENK